MRNMKIVELKLDDAMTGEGITAISLVKHPAIEQNWIAFNAADEIVTPEMVRHQQQLFAFKTIDEEQRVIAGPAMIPDKLIYRIDPDGEEFFVFFNKDTIRDLSEQFLLQGKQNNMTLEHESTLNDLSVVESWIVEDSEKDKSSMYGYQLPPGSWFVKVKVLNDDVWNLVKEDSVSGFSVEGVFTRDIIKNSKLNMSKKTKLDMYLDKVRSVFKESEASEKTFKLAKIIEVNKWDIEVSNTTFAEGDKVMATGFDGGEDYGVQDGEYLLEDGRKIQVDSDSVIVLIQEKGEFAIPAQTETQEENNDDAEKFGTVEGEGVDGSIEITFPGEVLEVGAEITTLVDEVATPVPTGEYTLSDGSTLVVVEDGVVGELKPAEEEEAAENEEEMESDSLKGEQIDTLIDGIAEIIANFQTDVKTQITESNEKLAADLRVEFNKPAAQVEIETPETEKAKDKIVQGLNKFVKAKKEETK